MPAYSDYAADPNTPLDIFGPMSSRRSSDAFGVALTSPTSHDERQKSPGQNPHRSSLIADTYQDLVSGGGSRTTAGRDSVEYTTSRRPADRYSMRSVNAMAHGSGATPVYDDAGRRRSQQYEEQLKNGAGNASRERVHRSSPIVAELKTNVIIKDEFTLVTDLSRHLAQRYTRPDSSVMVRIDHSACLALGGTFDPCYILKIQTVPSQMGPSTNKRNASAIQSFMSDILSVPSERGIITFTPIAEENLAFGGRTMLADMEKGSSTTNAASGGASAKNTMSGAEAQRKNAYRKSLNEARSGSYLSSAPDNSQDTTPTPSLLSDATSSANVDGRPRTAPRGGQVNGLRMNGISTENLLGNAARTPSGRPKTFDGTSTSRRSSGSVQDEIKRSNEPLPTLASRQSTGSSLTTLRANGGHRGSKVDIKKIGAPTGMQKNSLQGPGATHAVPKLSLTPALLARGSEPRAKNTYLDGSRTLTQKHEGGKLGAEDEEEDGRSEANTGRRRRRSTMTATPKLPPGPPPVPEEAKDTKSTKSLRLGKRRSGFLRGFIRRSTAA